MVQRAGTVIIGEAADIPPLCGPQTRPHRSQVDYVIAGDDVPVPERPNAVATGVDRAVARLIANEVEDDGKPASL